jgi:hypothetical protein
LAIAIIIQRYFPSSDSIDFIVGLLFGISIVLNFFYIYSRAKQNRSKKD